MQRALAFALAVLQCCDICATIRVPIVWDGDSEVTHPIDDEPKTSADKIKSQNLQQPVPVDYFQYTANKPQFAVDIAKFHGVHSPEEHYKAHPVRPYTAKQRPEIGRHKIHDPKRPVFHEFQKYIHKDENSYQNAKPASADYEVFHPYKAEEPGFQELYKDPVLDKIRNDIRDSSQRLHTYETEAGKPNIESGEYLESIEETERKKFPHPNKPAPYETHRPQRRPIYYGPRPRYPNRDHILNQRFKHPWNQNYVKIRPVHYVPLQNHIHRLRQNHALKYDDERNEYPQVPVINYEEPSDGYDIYERGKEKYVQLRNNLDESINDIVKESRPPAPEKLEFQDNDQPGPDEEDEFVPVKNYAQVRKTETTKHLPRSAAFDDAESYEEIKNAPRLREAIKSTKAQTVYTEEGYEDSAYDHAGEQKHATDHEGHAGFLKEHELSGGKYKAPSVSGSFEDSKGSAYRDHILHGKNWKDNKKDSQKEEDLEDFSEDEHEKYLQADSYQHRPASAEDIQRNKRQDDSKSLENSEDGEASEVAEDSGNIDESESDEDTSTTNATFQHDVSKRETKDFKLPQIDLDSVFLNEKDILDIAKEKIVGKDNLEKKYPYYFNKLTEVNKHSPLRYAENLKFIPKKSKGGTEFYDSRSHLVCPDVDDKVDAIPEKLKKHGHPDEQEGSEEENSDKNEKRESGEAARLSGLGDKIDCFKAKYFGQNPLDSPFFNEEIISNPEPITVPSLASFKLNISKKPYLLTSAPSHVVMNVEKLRNGSNGDLFELLSNLNNTQNKLIDSVLKETENFKTVLIPQNFSFKNSSSNSPQSSIYDDVLHNVNLAFRNFNISHVQNNTQEKDRIKVDETLYNEEVTHAPIQKRKKRAAPFVYEPYKIIRDVQVPDSKKTTTSSNISPLIKQLQSSKVIDAVKDQSVKRAVPGRTYKDIGRKDREKNSPPEITDNGFVDVNVDKRRGEPRYELRLSNHKSQYSPIENKKSVSVEDYEAQTKKKLISMATENDKPLSYRTEIIPPRQATPQVVYDISSFLPKPDEIQSSAASNTIKTTVQTSPAPTTGENEEPTEDDSSESEEDYDEYDDENDDEEEQNARSSASKKTTTTTTTAKPIFRRRIRSTTTTEKEEETTEPTPKLQLVTRFNSPPSTEKRRQSFDITTHKTTKKYDEIDETPRYREKKKKSTKSTIVTDTKKYGNDDEDDMRKEEIDVLIGVKHDMDDYKPTYEKEAENNKKVKDTSEQEDSSEENGDDDDDDDIESDEDEENNDYEDEEEDDDDQEEKSEDITTPKTVVTTTVAPKRTLVRTTDAPRSTTESRSAKLEIKPKIFKKKIEIHKESPVNKSSPHVIQYKQDIKEVEIIKEMPMKTPKSNQNKNLELLDFYKDENLAKNINQLGGVEIFKEDLDIKTGPKHGGNYRRVPDLEEQMDTTTVQTIRRRNKRPPKDAVTSQTENKKHVELEDDIPARRMHGGNLKSINEFKSRGSRKSEKLIELTTEDTNTKIMHGGNLKSIQDQGGKRFGGRNSKLIELDDSSETDHDGDSIEPMHGGNFKQFESKGGGRGSRLHGGNYRNAKIVADNIDEDDDTKSLAEITKTDTSKNPRINAAVLLNSFAQAAPILTATPAYILDPSKRMYYYVDA